MSSVYGRLFCRCRYHRVLAVIFRRVFDGERIAHIASALRDGVGCRQCYGGEVVHVAYRVGYVYANPVGTLGRSRQCRRNPHFRSNEQSRFCEQESHAVNLFSCIIGRHEYCAVVRRGGLFAERACARQIKICKNFRCLCLCRRLMTIIIIFLGKRAFAGCEALFANCAA